MTPETDSGWSHDNSSQRRKVNLSAQYMCVSTQVITGITGSKIAWKERAGR